MIFRRRAAILTGTIVPIAAFVAACSAHRHESRSESMTEAREATRRGPRQTIGIDDVSRAANLAAHAVSASGAKRVGVLEMRDLDGRRTMLGKLLAEEITTAVQVARTPSVVERRLVDEMTSEGRLSATGLIDDATAAELGGKLGADAVLAGTLADLGDRLRFNFRVIATKTGQVMAADQATIVMDASLRKLWSQETSPTPREPAPPQTTTPAELVRNPKFKDGWESDWDKRISFSDPQAAGVNWVKREGDALHLFHKQGASMITLEQLVHLPTTAVRIRVRARFAAGGYVDTMSRSMITLEYLNAHEKVLGRHLMGALAGWEARLFGRDSAVQRTLFFRSFTNSHGVTDDETITVDLNEELGMYLIGIRRDEVTAVRIKVQCGGVRAWDGSLGSAEMWLREVSVGRPIQSGAGAGTVPAHDALFASPLTATNASIAPERGSWYVGTGSARFRDFVLQLGWMWPGKVQFGLDLEGRYSIPASVREGLESEALGFGANAVLRMPVSRTLSVVTTVGAGAANVYCRDGQQAACASFTTTDPEGNGYLKVNEAYYTGTVSLEYRAGRFRARSGLAYTRYGFDAASVDMGSRLGAIVWLGWSFRKDS